MRDLIYKANDLMKLNNIFTVLTLTTIILHSNASSAETIDEAKQFQVDIIVFKNLSPETEESFNHPPRGVDDAEVISLVNFSPMTERQQQLLPTNTYVLGEEEKKLKRSRNFSVLSHFSWLIKLSENQSLSYQIPSQIDEENDTEMKGQISIALRRYLHATPNITLSRWAAPEPTFLDNLFNELEAPTSFLPDNPDLNTTQNGAESPLTPEYAPITPDLSGHPLSARGLVPREYYTIHQARRMRSGEVHYFDHPMFGLLIKIVPVAETVSASDPAEASLNEEQMQEQPSAQ